MAEAQPLSKVKLTCSVDWARRHRCLHIHAPNLHQAHDAMALPADACRPSCSAWGCNTGCGKVDVPLLKVCLGARHCDAAVGGWLRGQQRPCCAAGGWAGYQDVAQTHIASVVKVKGAHQLLACKYTGKGKVLFKAANMRLRSYHTLLIKFGGHGNLSQAGMQCCNQFTLSALTSLSGQQTALLLLDLHRDLWALLRPNNQILVHIQTAALINCSHSDGVVPILDVLQLHGV